MGTGEDKRRGTNTVSSTSTHEVAGEAKDPPFGEGAAATMGGERDARRISMTGAVRTIECQEVHSMSDDDRYQGRRELRAMQLRRNRPARGPSAGVKVDRVARYYGDPVAFAKECIRWPEGQSPTEYQEEILRELPRKLRVSVRSLHGAGKTTALALAVLWFAVTREEAGVDWKCPTTAGSQRQLKYFLWPDIRQWGSRLRWDVIGRSPFVPGIELLKTEINLEHGSAFAMVSNDPYLIEGVHARAVLYVFDEAKAIDAAVFDAAEGAFSGPGEAFGLNASTPGVPERRFYDIQRRKPGLADWYPVHVSLERALASGRVDPAWAEQRKAQWGEHSPLYANRVLGEFKADDEEGVIPLAWVEAAVGRWKEHQDVALGPLTTVGVDVARSGNDKTIMALRYGHRLQELRATFHEDTMTTTGHLVGILGAHPGAIGIVDADGLGAGVFDRTREQGHRVDAFHAAAQTTKRTAPKSSASSMCAPPPGGGCVSSSIPPTTRSSSCPPMTCCSAS